MGKHKWKEFASIIGAPYRKRFSTNRYGDWRIDNVGLYSYEDKRYTSDKYCGEWDGIYMFLSGEIEVVSMEEIKKSKFIETSTMFISAEDS